MGARKLAMFDPDDDATGPPPIRSDVATVAQILDWFVESNRGKQRKDIEAERFRIFRLFAGEYGKLRCTDARPHNLEAFLNAHVGERSAWTIKRWNATLQRPFNVAVRLGLILANPFKGLTYAQGEDGRDWTDAEYAAVLRTASPNLRRFFVFMRFSGMRPGEVRALLWSDIKPEIGAIVIIRHKTMKKTKLPRRIPINSVLAKLLNYQRRHVPLSSPHVFLNAAGRPWTMRALNRGFVTLRGRAGLPKSVKPHGLRHLYATRAIMNGLDAATLAELLGHTDMKTTNRYCHLAGKNEHLSAAAELAIGGRKPDQERKQ